MIRLWRARIARARDSLCWRRPALTGLAAACLAMVLFSGLAAGGETRAGQMATTHRPGDLIVYMVTEREPVEKFTQFFGFEGDIA